MQAENLYEFLSVKLSGEATRAELDALEQYLVQHPEERLHVENFEKIWKARNLLQVPVSGKTSFEKHLDKIKAVPPGPFNPDIGTGTKAKTISIRRKLLQVSAVAASAILIFLLVYYITNKPGRGDLATAKDLQVVSTRYGLKKKLLLPDGTQVWLNSGSSITYNKVFSVTSREVHLSGEAYFDVVKETERPFIIYTRIMDVKVLGTAFNIRSYPDERTTETFLIRGRVQIILHQNPGKDLFLNPNEKIIIQDPSANKNKQQDLAAPEPKVILTRNRLKQDSTAMETSWMLNKLAFDNETLEQIASKLERWFDVKVKIQDEGLKSTTYYGVFEDENLEEVLTALQLTGKFHFKILDNKEVIITP